MTDRPKTCAERARKILRHEESCRRAVLDGWHRGKTACTCPDLPLPIRVAAGMGRLREEHIWLPDESEFGAGYECSRCKKQNGYPFVPDDESDSGPCYRPLDGALAWELFRKIQRAWRNKLLRLPGSTERIGWDWSLWDEQAIGELFCALVDAGVIEVPRVG
jgi:hypothetical protein